MTSTAMDAATSLSSVPTRWTSSLNVNGVTFTRSNVGVWPLSGVTLRDMNSDGKVDLVVASGRF